MRANKITSISLIIASKIIFSACLQANGLKTDIDVGLPLGEALYDLAIKKYVIISTPLNYINGLNRVDCFMLNKDKIIYIHSKASKHGDTYKIIKVASFRANEIGSISIKELKFFSNFDLGKCEGFNQ